MQTVETCTLQVNNNSFTGPLIIGTFEKRAPAPYKESRIPKSVKFLLVKSVIMDYGIRNTA